ncbi:hypothetical protein [Cryptosporangium phraense]|uniref:YfhO family protein n=1 Tax=Cryptosporangium phraense TaxID=2593070 RepID=A0A545AJJ3_9ACTN|nr:hypothetical protein [Cryptosporangium phraense]TQS41503.1 hypothetical protein FL583_28880 [Cryptosporangium phraense]
MARGRAEHVLAAVLALLMLAPVLRPGYVLAYDQVATPRVPFTAATLGWGDGLPRAVPQDAVVAALSLAVPGWVVQVVAVVAIVWLAVVGAARLVPSDRVLVRLVAGAAYGWNAYVAERLLIGHWGLLLGYAALPWIVRSALAARSGAHPAPVVAWSALAALTPTGGLLAAITATAVLCRPVAHSDVTRAPDEPRADEYRARPGWALAVVALNAPWVIAGAVAKVSAVSDPDGVPAFAARAENWSGTLGALLGLGGIWNAETVPASRTSAAAPLFTLIVLAVAVVGLRPLAARWGRASFLTVAAVAAGGFLIAAAGALPGGPSFLGAVVAHVPGSGLLRDGQKFLAPYALLLAICFALGTERLVPHRGRLPAAVLALALLYPVLVLPDLAWGGAGRLSSVHYPADWDRAARELRRDPHGSLVVLPFSSFRAFPWNGDRTVLDPAPRYFPVDVVVEDSLTVGPDTVSGESPRAREVGDALAAGRSLATARITWVLVERTTPGSVPPSALDGFHPVVNGPELTLYRADSAPRADQRPETVRKVSILTGYGIAVVVLLAALASWALARRSLVSPRPD